MIRFSEYINLKEQEGVDSTFVNNVDSKNTVKPVVSQQQSLDQERLKDTGKKWSMSKEEVMRLWRGLPLGTPIAMKPVDNDHKGSTFSEDAIRITGSTEFIESVISRLKEFLKYESETTKLNVSFRETSSPSLEEEGMGKKSYVFYIQSKTRG
jgi:hypothetical protein